MKQIREAHSNILAILGAPKPAEGPYRLMKYCVPLPVEDGVLLFHVMTRELLLLTEEEYRNCTTLPELRARWFTVPEAPDEKELVKLIRWVRQSSRKKGQPIRKYTIMTTTDCNARCFYCYELGRSRIPMSAETARKTAAYIGEHCAGEPVQLTWFGGEPLFNLPVIDQISGLLRQQGTEFTADMVSNGYLFDDALVERAVKAWNLRSVQISLDGTEEIYNSSKGFIHTGPSPYRVVLDNMDRLLTAGIRVSVRLNADLYNGADLKLLIRELAERFGGREGLRVYVALLEAANEQEELLRSDEEWSARFALLRELEDLLAACGLDGGHGLAPQLKISRCVADSGNSVLIAPTGDIGLCDHHSEDEFVAHLDSPEWDAKAAASWQQPADELPACRECFYYPACFRLKKCNNPCVPQTAAHHRRTTERGMLYEYRSWKAKNPEITNKKP